MDFGTAKRIIEALADGHRPEDWRSPRSRLANGIRQCVRALHAALTALDYQIGRRTRDAGLPSNAGKPWNAEDDRVLVALLESGRQINNIADTFRRARINRRAASEARKDSR
jgi:hypothetical protein